MATFVPLGEEDLGYDLALVLNQVNNPSEKKAAHPNDEGDEEEEDVEFTEAKASALGKLVTAKKYQELIEKGFLGSLDKIMAQEEDQIDTAFSLAFALLHNLKEEQVGSFIKNLYTRLADEKTKDTLTELKLNLLCVMFNLLDAANMLRKEVFMVLLKFAHSTNNGGVCIGQLKLLSSWILAWKLSDTEEAELYLLVSQLCEQAGEFIQSQSYLVKYLTTISKSTDAKLRDAGKPHAARAAVAAIRSFSENPMEFPQFDCDRIRKIPAVSSLENDKKYSTTYALLKIFAAETVGEYFALVKKHPKLCEELKLDHDTNLQKLRTFTICSLGMQQERISYKTLMEQLKVEDNDGVESVIIDAVMAGRVDAKIDQETEEVVIQRTTQRVFNKGDWKTIGTKLGTWKSNIIDVLKTLHQVHIQTMADEPDDQQ